MQHMIRVLTGGLSRADGLRALRDDTPLDSKVVDWNDSSDRKWLTNHLHWAVNNGQAVLIRPLTFTNAAAESN
jgi:hypothetical protein